MTAPGRDPETRKQKITIVVGAVLLVLVSLFPPWIVTDTTAREGPEQSQAGFHWVLNPKLETNMRGKHAMVDEPGRDGFQVGIVALTIMTVVLLGGGRKKA